MIHMINQRLFIVKKEIVQIDDTQHDTLLEERVMSN